ncbi:spore germination protein KA [Paenibacillus shirakamiensis]|uniref:Spore germination protein KA n=1 Tax=Paenibacillus shirakamiensis TaxID=1265935 RepID=A0ABS4JIF0_9BACL|nr:spore germination protein [Paenibacillus shirakamiensis]MBP2001482.1 spore germination protein KA [Paenibacillus shirakamiensis]
MRKRGLAIEQIRDLLKDSDDVEYQEFLIHKQSYMLIYIPSIVDMEVIHKQIAYVLVQEALSDDKDQDLVSKLNNGSLFPLPNNQIQDPPEAVNALVEGKAILCAEHFNQLYLFDLVKYQKRAVSESQNELVVIGPQEAFIEDINSNLSLLRHKIKHPAFKTIRYEVGKYTKTIVYMVYIEGLCKPEVVAEVDKGIAEISIDGALGISYLSEQMKKGNHTPFPQFQYTERPDSVAASLLEGRVGILQDGTPSALLVPVTLFSLLQSSEDYYQSYMSASWIRIVRIFFAIISLILPSLYVAITTFQSEMIPSDLLLTIAAARENIPFSALTEALIMELTFEGLREAGTRIPKPVGQTVSIIGAIVIGQAAVQAGIVSAPMVIVVSVTGIASYIIPHFELGLAMRLLRFPLLIIGGTTGLIGVFILTFIIFGHLVSLKTFGAPYMQPLAPIVLQDWKDVFFRVPSPGMTKRSSSFTNRNIRRQPKK